jgi:hypothetical protein
MRGSGRVGVGSGSGSGRLDRIDRQALTDRQTDSTNARSAFDTHEK